MASLAKRLSNHIGYLFKAKPKRYFRRKAIVKKRKEKLTRIAKNHPTLEAKTGIRELYSKFNQELTSPEPNWNVVDNLVLLANRFVDQGRKNVELYKQAYFTQRSIDRKNRLKNLSKHTTQIKLQLEFEETNLRSLEEYLKYVEHRKKNRKN